MCVFLYLASCTRLCKCEGCRMKRGRGRQWRGLQRSCFDMNVSFAHLSSLINIFFIFLFMLLLSSKTRLPQQREPEPVCWPFHACSQAVSQPAPQSPLSTFSHTLPMAFYVLHLSACICNCSYSYSWCREYLCISICIFVCICVWVCRCRRCWLWHVAYSMQRSNVIALFSTLHQKQKYKKKEQKNMSSSGWKCCARWSWPTNQ